MSIITDALKDLLKVLLPARCSLCGEVIELNKKYCEKCKNPPVIKAPLCISCGASKKDCSCKKHKNEYKQIVAPYYYADQIVVAIHRFKESDMPFLAKKLADDMTKCITENYCEINFDIITFVPLRELHQMRRGFNQSELLADIISENISVPVEPLLEKVRYTGVQHHKNMQRRKADVFGAYDVADEYKSDLYDKIILLIDDVKTTGSTLNECAKMLKIRGAKEVYCASAAITKRNRKK